MLRTIATRLGVVILAELAIVAVVAGITLLANGGVGAPMTSSATYATVAHIAPAEPRSATCWNEPGTTLRLCDPGAADDLDHDGVITEGEPGWDGTRMGNRQISATVVDHEKDGSWIVACPDDDRVRNVYANDAGVIVCQY